MPLDAIPRHMGLAAHDVETLAGLPEGYFREKASVIQLARLRTHLTNASDLDSLQTGTVLPFRFPPKR